MAHSIIATPDAGATPNDIGATLGASVEIELIQIPETLIDADLTGATLESVNLAGINLSKGAMSTFIPWSNIIAIFY